MCAAAALVLSFAPHKITAAPAALVSPAAVPEVDPQIVAKAKEWFHRFQTGHIDRSQLDEKVNRGLTKSMIRNEAATLKAFGTPLAFAFISSGPAR